MIRVIVITVIIIVISVVIVRFFFARRPRFDPDTATVNNRTAESRREANANPGTAEQAMPDSVREEIAEHIQYYINSGFYDREETKESIRAGFYEETIDEAWLHRQVEKEYTRRLREQAGWPAETSFDRLAKAFDRLNASGIIALHNAGNTKQDATGDAEDIYEELKAKGITVKGYCYYHAQDMERAMDGQPLFVGFGDFDNDDNSALETGKKVVKALEAYGFNINWDKSVETRIEILNIKWQKRFGNDNCSRERVIRLLTGL